MNDWIKCSDRLPESWKSDIISKMWDKDIFVTDNVLVRFIPKDCSTEDKAIIIETYFRNGIPAKTPCIDGVKYIPYEWKKIN